MSDQQLPSKPLESDEEMRLEIDDDVKILVDFMLRKVAAAANWWRSPQQ